MSANPVLWDLDARGVATVTLNRPEVNNAYDAGLINGVLAAMAELGKPWLNIGRLTPTAIRLASGEKRIVVKWPN